MRRWERDAAHETARRAREREFVYGRNAVAEAKGAAARSPRLDRRRAAAEELTRLAGSPDHQGVVAEVDPYPYADPEELLEPAGAGGRARPGPGPAQPRRRVPVGRGGGRRRRRDPRPALGPGDARRLQGLGGGGRAPDVARVRNLADWLTAAKDAGGWVYGAERRAPTRYERVDLDGLAVLVLGGEGKGIRPRVAASCDVLVSIPRPGRSARSTCRPPPRCCCSRRRGSGPRTLIRRPPSSLRGWNGSRAAARSGRSCALLQGIVHAGSGWLTDAARAYIPPIRVNLRSSYLRSAKGGAQGRYGRH